MRSPIRKRLAFSERGSVWLAAGVLLSAAIGALGVGAARGKLGAVFGDRAADRVLRGYTPAGLSLGITAVVLTMLAAIYSLRKRPLQERLPGRGTMTGWLWLHVVASILALVAAAAHAGHGLLSTEVSTGKVLAAIFAALALSGLVWRLAYVILPPLARRAAGKRAEDDGARARSQARTTRALQVWRVFHVPLTLLFFPALAAHVVLALELHVDYVPTGEAPIQELSGFHRSRECASCHRAIFDQWSTSMHAHALRSPVTIAQNNQLLDADLGAARSPDPRRFCVNCHGPVAVAASGKTRLPLRREGYEDALLDEGIGCATCHQWRGTESPGGAGLSRFQRGLRPGSTYFGATPDPVGNAFHRSRPASIFKRDGALCAGCHSVQHDRDGDGKIQKGVDLVLQTTQEEYDAYVAKGGRSTCVGCHMPVREGASRTAERARIPTQQDREAPPRVVHDHSFVGVDYPIDEVAQRDPQRAAREALIRSAARLDLTDVAVKGSEVTLKAGVTNVGVGHNLPSGLAFARQMWLEVQITNEAKKVIFASGVLAKPSEDLCDAGTLDDPGNPARPFVVGCKVADKQLVSFQQKLVDRIDVERGRDGKPILDARGETRPIAAAGAKEAWMQHLTAGVVPRVRPRDAAVLSPIAPDETRTFGYAAPVGDARRLTVSVRLLFRSQAPYMLRALGSKQRPGETQLAPLVENLQVVEMASKTATIDVPVK